MDKKTKVEQFFILFVTCIGMLGLLLVSGCGNCNSCETIKCGSSDISGGKATGISIPGCGGCFTPGWGCNSWQWPQSCKISCADGETGSMDSEAGEGEGQFKIIGCGTRYFGDGCWGCADCHKEKACYSGYISIDNTNASRKGFFYGCADEEEKMLTCSNGCGGCVSDDNVGGDLLYELELEEGIF